MRALKRASKKCLARNNIKETDVEDSPADGTRRPYPSVTRPPLGKLSLVSEEASPLLRPLSLPLNLRLSSEAKGGNAKDVRHTSDHAPNVHISWAAI